MLHLGKGLVEGEITLTIFNLSALNLDTKSLLCKLYLIME